MESLIKNAISKHAQTFVITGGQIPFFECDGRRFRAGDHIISSASIVQMLQKIIPEKMENLKAGGSVEGFYSFPSLGQIAFVATYKNPNVHLVFSLGDFLKNNVEKEKPKIKHSSFKEASEHKDFLASCISEDASLLKNFHSYCSKNELFLIHIKSEEFSDFIERFTPKILIFDEKNSNSQDIFLEIYEIETKKRIEMNVVMIGDNVKSGDQMSAFCYSVDYVLNRRDSDHLLQHIQVSLKRQKETLSLYKEFI